MPVPGGREICEKQLLHQIDRIEKAEVDNPQIESFLPSIHKKLEWLDREELIKKFVSLEFNRFLDYYKNTPDLNPVSVKEKINYSEEKITRYFINLGSSHKLQPQTLLRLINEFTGDDRIEVGDIEILKNFSFFETDKKYTDLIIRAFTGKKFKGREIGVEVASRKKTGNKSSGRSRREKNRPTNRQKKGNKRKQKGHRN
jgi:ATP-dependent RNA helicase DeaD